MLNGQEQPDSGDLELNRAQFSNSNDVFGTGTSLEGLDMPSTFQFDTGGDDYWGIILSATISFRDLEGLGSMMFMEH